MASTDPQIAWPDKYVRTQQKLAVSTKSFLERQGRARFFRSLPLLVELWEDSLEKVVVHRRLRELWKTCLAQDRQPADELFRAEAEGEPYARLCLYTGANVLLSDLLYKPTETAVWEVFVQQACRLKEVVIPFGVRRSKLPWVLSNHANLNSRLKQPLRTYIAVPPRKGANEVVVLPLVKACAEEACEL